MFPSLKTAGSYMKALNQLDWKAAIVFTSHGSRFGIRVNDPALLRQITSCFPPGHRSCTSETVDYLYSLRIVQSYPRSRELRYELYTNRGYAYKRQSSTTSFATWSTS